MATKQELMWHERYKEVIIEKRKVDDQLEKVMAAFTALANDHANMKRMVEKMREALQ